MDVQEKEIQWTLEKVHVKDQVEPWRLGQIPSNLGFHVGNKSPRMKS